jgi:hypothetical protein
MACGVDCARMRRRHARGRRRKQQVVNRRCACAGRRAERPSGRQDDCPGGREGTQVQPRAGCRAQCVRARRIHVTPVPNAPIDVAGERARAPSWFACRSSPTGRGLAPQRPDPGHRQGPSATTWCRTARPSRAGRRRRQTIAAPQFLRYPITALCVLALDPVAQLTICAHRERRVQRPGRHIRRTRPLRWSSTLRRSCRCVSTTDGQPRQSGAT